MSQRNPPNLYLSQTPFPPFFLTLPPPFRVIRGNKQGGRVWTRPFCFVYLFRYGFVFGK